MGRPTDRRTPDIRIRYAARQNNHGSALRGRHFTAEVAEDAEGELGLRDINDITGAVITGALEVHSALGPGLLESAYQACLAHELRLGGRTVAEQVPMPVVYRGHKLDVGYRLDMIVDDAVLVEIKAIAKLLPVHDAQVISYLRLSGYRVGLLINFHVPRLRDGLRRFANSR